MVVIGVKPRYTTGSSGAHCTTFTCKYLRSDTKSRVKKI